MRFRRPPPNEYGGLCMFVMGSVWRVSVGKEVGEEYRYLPPELLFNTDVLANRLRAVGVGVQGVKLEGAYCIIIPTAGQGRVAPVRRRICVVLREHYSLYRGDPINWEWAVRQYD